MPINMPPTKIVNMVLNDGSTVSVRQVGRSDTESYKLRQKLEKLRTAQYEREKPKLMDFPDVKKFNAALKRHCKKWRMA